MAKRIYLFDNLKGLLIALVVVGHFADTYIRAPFFKSIYVFIYAFHMPAFIFISGYFHKNEDIKRKLMVYFSIGYLLKIIDFLVFLALGQKPQLKPFSEDGAPWYMFALCAFIGIAYIGRNIDIRLQLALALILGLFSGYYEFFGDFLVLSRILVFYPYYLLGMLVARIDYRNIRRLLNKLQASILVKYLAAAIIGGWAFWCFADIDRVYNLRRLFTGRNSFGIRFGELGCLYRACCYVLAVALVVSIVIIIPDKKLFVFSKVGTCTMQIYFWHWPIVFIIGTKLPVAEWCDNLYGQMLYILCAVIFALILALPIFKYPTKWFEKKKHLSYEDEIARLFKE